MKNFTPDELVVIAYGLTNQAYGLLEKYPGDKDFQDKAQYLIILADKALELWHSTQTQDIK